MASLFVLGSVTGCGDDAATSKKEPMKCLGDAALCARTLPEVTLAATHNSFSYAEGGDVDYLYPNQDHPISAQLTYGIRALGIRPCPYYGDVPSEQDVVYVTHNTDLKGLLGTEPLKDILLEVKTFLDDNPTEIVELLAESAVTPARVAGVFDEVGLVPYLYTHDKQVGWPTLEKMIQDKTRLIVFNDSQDADRPVWQHYMWDFIVDTDYNITDPSQFSCEFYRGHPSNDLYFLNEFVYKDLGSGALVPDETLARVANAPEFVLKRAEGCWKEKNRRPNFIYVDRYGQGDVKKAVDELNQLTSAPR